MRVFRRKQAQSVPARRLSNASRRESRATESDLAETYVFRRNRTLTGSLASRVSSASETRSELRSSRLQAHDLRHHQRHLLRTLVITLMVAGGLGYGIYQSIADPQIVVAGLSSVDTAPYRKGIQDYLNTHPLERTRFTLNTSALTGYLQEKDCPEVALVSPDVVWSGLGASTFTITLRHPVVSWKTGATLHFVDDQGNAFSRNYFTAPSVQVIDETGLSASSGQVLTSGRFLSFLGRIIGQMKARGSTVTKVVLPPTTTHQVQVSVDGVSYPVKFSVDRPAGEQAEDAARAMKYLSDRGTIPEYLDVRVSGKAFYK